jgi:hypothetical protein
MTTSVSVRRIFPTSGFCYSLLERKRLVGSFSDTRLVGTCHHLRGGPYVVRVTLGNNGLPLGTYHSTGPVWARQPYLGTLQGAKSLSRIVRR